MGVTEEQVLTQDEALDLFLARIELNAVLLRLGDYPVIGLKNVKLFRGASRLLNALPSDHPFREKYNPTEIDRDLKEIARYYAGVESANYKPETNIKTA